MPGINQAFGQNTFKMTQNGTTVTCTIVLYLKIMDEEYLAGYIDYAVDALPKGTWDGGIIVQWNPTTDPTKWSTVKTLVGTDTTKWSSNIYDTSTSSEIRIPLTDSTIGDKFVKLRIAKKTDPNSIHSDTQTFNTRVYQLSVKKGDQGSDQRIAAVGIDTGSESKYALKGESFTLTASLPNNYGGYHYEFVRWKEENSGSIISTSNPYSGKLVNYDNPNVVFGAYGHKIANSYTIKYDSNGGTGSMANTSAIYGQEVTIPSCSFKKSSHQFTHWTSSNVSGKISPGKQILSYTPPSDGLTITFNANWEKYLYHLEIPYGTGIASVTANATDHLYKENDSVVISCKLQTGYSLDRWVSDKPNLITDSPAGQTTYSFRMPADDLTLEPVATPNKYGVIYDANGGTSPTGATIPKETWTYDEYHVIADNIYAKTGYNFACWRYNNQNYYPGNSYVNLATSDELTMKAVWEPKTYTIVLEREGATSGQTSVTATYNTTLPALSTIPVRKGYVFQGYYSQQNGGGAQYYDARGKSNKVYQADAGLTIYAYWKPITYYLLFNANDGNGTMQSQTCTYDVNFNIKKSAFRRDGCEFIGWSRVKNGDVEFTDGQYIDVPLTSVAENITLYAVWKGNLRNITLHCGDATEMIEVYVASKLPSVSVPEKKGYLFQGYFETAKGSGTQFYDSQGNSKNPWLKDADGDMYAYFAPITYTVRYHGNGATSTTEMNPSTHKYDTPSPLSANTYKKTGYFLQCWQTADGSQTFFDKQTIVNLTEINGAAIDLYAVWAESNIAYYSIEYPEGSGKFRWVLCYLYHSDGTNWIPVIPSICRDNATWEVTES